MSISEAGAIDQLTGDQNVLYSLGTRRTKMVGEDGQPVSKPKKSAMTQEQADELKRQQFLKILEEQQKKIKDREIKMKQKQTGIMANIGGAGRQANAPHLGSMGGTLQANIGASRWRPGMEQFVNAIKLRSSKKTGQMQLCMPQGFLLPEVLRQKQASELQKRIEQRRKKSDCFTCKKKDARKYVCAKT